MFRFLNTYAKHRHSFQTRDMAGRIKCHWCISDLIKHQTVCSSTIWKISAHAVNTNVDISCDTDLKFAHCNERWERVPKDLDQKRGDEIRSKCADFDNSKEQTFWINFGGKDQDQIVDCKTDIELMTHLKSLE
jgi:hypothetical protein